jgi:hypothetical protein
MVDPALSDQSLREKYKLKDNRDWQLRSARAALQASEAPQASITASAYRPFDTRECFFGYEFMDYPRREFLEHVHQRRNILLLSSRQVSDQWRHVFVADSPANDCVVSDESSEANHAFPAYLYPDAGQLENLSPAFRSFINTRYSHHYTPEEVLGYIYAVLHAPTYRARFGEFLRIDFPRIPLAETSAQFEMLSALGWQLAEAHLLKTVPRRKLAQFHGRGSQGVDKVEYSPLTQSLAINVARGLGPFPVGFWAFPLGGYQVLDKYLRSRKGRTLSLDEINHVSAVADSVAFTIEQMGKIDAAFLAAFPNGEMAD